MPSSRKKIRTKYLKGLSKSDKAKQKEAILKSRKDAKGGKYKPRPKLKSFQNKKSPHVKKALKKFNLVSMKDLEKISKETGCSMASLKIILKKGRGAYYSDGSRANQNADSWAYARLASAITGGGASKVDYKHLKSGKCNSKVMKVTKKPKKQSRARKPKKFKIQKKEKKPIEKPWITYAEAHKYEDEAKEQNVSKVARSARGFMRAYEKDNTKTKLEKIKVPKFPKQNWRQRRNAFVARHLIQYNKKTTPRRWLALVMWAYKPPGRRPKKSTKKVKYVRKTRGMARTFKMGKRRKSKGKKPTQFQGHVTRTRGGTPIFIRSKNLHTYNPNWSDVSAESILNSRLPPFQKYLLLGVWAAANYSPGTKIPDIIQGDGGYLRDSALTPGIIPMRAPSSYATYSPGLLLESISPYKPVPRQVVRAQGKRKQKSPKRLQGKRKQKSPKRLQGKISSRKNY